MATDELLNFTVCVDKVLLKKLDYIAAFDGRSRNEECELMICEWVRAFEDSDGEIDINSTITVPKKTQF